MHGKHRHSQTRRAPRSRLTRKQGPSAVSPGRDLTAILVPTSMTACTVLGMACTRQHDGRLPVYPSEEDRNRLLDEHWFQRAVQVYLGALPAVNMIGMRDGSEAKFGVGYNVLPVWKRLMDAGCRRRTRT